uniref:Toll-like receptor 8 n=1 Tax=Haplochromis burtoni TaxID=8153 RepID=A0A3Q2VPX2_HAPBU
AFGKLFTNLSNLTILDISFNGIAKIPDDVYEYLPRNLTTLRISHNCLSDFSWDKLPFHQLQILDLSYNSLSTLTTINSNITQTLIFLDLSHNHIFHVDNGFLQRPAFLTLFLQGNPFECTCDLLDFVLWIEQSDVKIPRLTTQVTCNTPVNLRGQVLIRFSIHQCVNAGQAFQIYALTTSIIILFMVVSTVAHLFYWDASYVLHYMKAKLKGIQYSRKTLFVLTKGYVKTGAFKLAMYLAHQRLLDENVDVIVLLMLEPV